MPSNNESTGEARNRSNRIKLFVVVVFALIAAASGFWGYQRYRASGATLTTAEITELAKTAASEDRQAWLRLARAALTAENVQAIIAPTEPTNNRGEASRVELGYLLFFDPILSGDKTTSCASCHHPDYGMADGLKKGIGAGGHGYGLQRAGTGRELQRNTPSLFNVAYNPILFWDGRAGTLEEQALEPIFNEHELNQSSAAELVKSLRAIPKYRELFAKAFGFNSPQDGREITLQNIARAIAAFERKLNITETDYDQFVKGKDDKLTTEQLRGLVVFIGQGQCAACHIPPHFHDGVLSSTGTPVSAEKGAPLDSDPGFGAVIRREDGFGMFKTPGLRNVARTAPYMHNGAFNTLEEVVDFYNDGGGRGRGLDVYSQDVKVAKLNLTEQQKKDLVSFMKSLNDTAPPPQTPASVPSGLPVVGK
ncbi:MAG: Cytochrome c551 peroxidase [Acidobacteria bacterium]|nr:Cytochrome c551 peroxidase [Acidobacteriota bacterium]